MAASSNHAAARFLYGDRSGKGGPDTAPSLMVEEISPGLSVAVLPVFSEEFLRCPHAQRGWT